MTKLKLSFYSIKSDISDILDKEQISFSQETGILGHQTTLRQTFAFRPISNENQKIINKLLRKHSKAWRKLAYK